jgi:UDP-N-acetylmuramoyl-tripeptide--D-alanyl-D-alanine ligase
VTDRADGVTVVNDAYNANPDSMHAALAALAALGAGGRRRTWAVLGRMAELGQAGPAAHAELVDAARALGVAEVVAVDCPEYGAAREVAGIDGALELLAAELRPGDVVLVKASRAVGLDRVAAGLLEREPAA